VKGKVEMVPLPKGDASGSQHASTLGGWSLAVSRYSHQKEAAVSLVTWLTRPEEQKRRAAILGQNPTIKSLYQDPKLLKIFENAVPRPAGAVGTKYSRVSSEFWDAVHQILSGNIGVESGLKKLKSRLSAIRRGEKW
jgi:trehalose/maltose transport system substrate-binding protein